MNLLLLLLDENVFLHVQSNNEMNIEDIVLLVSYDKELYHNQSFGRILSPFNIIKPITIHIAGSNILLKIDLNFNNLTKLFLSIKTIYTN